MAHGESPGRGLVPIAPTPVEGGPGVSSQANASEPSMPYSCQTCTRRKVKCDKVGPACVRCRKGGFECVFEAPQRRPRKRKLDEAMEKIARYEGLLKQHGLLELEAVDPETSSSQSLHNSIPGEPVKPALSRPGRLLTGHGKSRYIDSHMWLNLEDEEIRHISTDDDDGIAEEAENTRISDPVYLGAIPQDPLTGALLGGQQSILHYHPDHADAMKLWKRHAQNVEPICKVLHGPSAGKLVQAVSQRPETASKAEECLLFSIYHCAVFSISEDACSREFGQDRSVMMRQFQAAARQAFVNASFLKTTEMAVLQALYLYLLSSRDAYDPHTYWILTGISARIGQRIGLHRDGESLGLPPFEVELRRRLFYQVFPHDSRASQSAGIDNVSLPQGWDTKPPLNINDDQIWPGMTERPVEQTGATDMIFCLSRAYMGRRLAEAGKSITMAGPWSSSDYQRAEQVISAAEKEVEEGFIRYCDIVNPLHFLTIGLARSGMTAMRLKFRLPRLRDETATDQERREIFQLAQKNLDTDGAVHSHTGTSRFQWHTKPFFLWGTRDSLVVVLMTLLTRRDLLTYEQIENAWNSVAELYRHHEELYDGRKALSVAMRCLALKAWDSWQSSSHASEPEFIGKLRLWRKPAARQNRDCDVGTALELGSHTPNFPSPVTERPDLGVLDGMEGFDFDFDVEDWISWDQLFKDNRT
ncbi:hypothetical protein PDE_00496 [Penicillium oxalicum 114-2]|uniref:Zn(2)-C6 fungal-type domain-containing protein n=1 Tax=Penicillium oxalicum (strain 114-2 / CGMCC 5302) TaxID=933388 RepID=S8AUN1_PENO1|nr:hypothetical protein PDE_00496 [Penicillium oxalicum 114-2]